MSFRKNFVEAEILGGCEAGEVIFIINIYIHCVFKICLEQVWFLVNIRHCELSRPLTLILCL